MCSPILADKTNKWFAWYPVTTVLGGRVWFRTVLRKISYHPDKYGNYHTKYSYVLLDKKFERVAHF